MKETVHAVLALGKTLAAMTLYGAGHPARATARTRFLAALHASLADNGSLRVSFIDTDVVIGDHIVQELRGWEWGPRLASCGIQRIEADATPRPTEEVIDVLLEAIHVRVSGLSDTPMELLSVGGMRAGPLAVIDADVEITVRSDGVVLSPQTLEEEAEAVRWIHEHVAKGGAVPTAEVETVVRGLAVAMQRDRETILPLLDMHIGDQFTTAHSCNVSMLAMGLAQTMGLNGADVRAIGGAALLHDIGKVALPAELLAKPGALTPEEYAQVMQHTVEGARILGTRGRGNALAATVAYEHHLWVDGTGGYPGLAFQRKAHFASRLVQVCNVYDSISSSRSYRDALPKPARLGYLRRQRGKQLDSDMVDAFLGMLTSLAETVEETANGVDA